MSFLNMKSLSHMIISIIAVSALFINNAHAGNASGRKNEAISRASNQKASDASDRREVNKFVIKPSFNYSNEKHDDLRLFKFYLNEGGKSLLKYPNRLTQVKFNNRILGFDQATLLPPQSNILSFDVFTCKDNVPVLIRVLGGDGFYYYSKNKRTGKWINYSLNNQKAFGKVDKNGADYYVFNTSNDFKQFYDLLNEELEELSGKLCRNVKVAQKSFPNPPALEVTIEQAKSESPLISIVPAPETRYELAGTNIPEEHIPKANIDMLIKGQLYYTALDLKQRLANQFVYLISLLEEEKIKNEHEKFVKDKREKFQEIKYNFHKSFAEFNNQTEKEGWINVLPKLSSNFSDLKELNDAVNDLVLKSYPEDEAKTFTYVSLIEKSNNLSYLLNNLDFILENMEMDAYDSEFGNNMQEFYTSRYYLTTLINNLLEEQDAEKRDEHFKELVAEANKASESFKKIITSVVDKRKENGVEVNSSYSKNVISFIDKITNVSRSAISKLLALIVPAMIMLFI